MSPPTWGFPLLAHRRHAHRDPCMLTALRTCSLARLQQHHTFVAWRTCSLVCIQDCTLTALQSCNPTRSRPCTLAASRVHRIACFQPRALPTLHAYSVARLQHCMAAALHTCSLPRSQLCMLGASHAHSLTVAALHVCSLAHRQLCTLAAPQPSPLAASHTRSPLPCCSGQPRASSLPALPCHGLGHFSSFKGNFILIFFLFSKIKFIRAEAVAEGVWVGWR